MLYRIIVISGTFIICWHCRLYASIKHHKDVEKCYNNKAFRILISGNLWRCQIVF